MASVFQQAQSNLPALFVSSGILENSDSSLLSFGGGRRLANSLHLLAISGLNMPQVYAIATRTIASTPQFSLIVLSTIIFCYADSASAQLEIDAVLATVASLLSDVPVRPLQFAAESLSRLMLARSEIVRCVIDWLKTTTPDQSLATLYKDLRWPPVDGVVKKLLDLAASLKPATNLIPTFADAILTQMRSISPAGDLGAGPAGYLGAVAHFAVSLKFEYEYVLLIEDGVECSPMLLLLSDFFARGPSPDLVGLFPVLLGAVTKKLSKNSDVDQANMVRIIGSLYSIAPEEVVAQFGRYLAAQAISGVVLGAICSFASKNNIQLQLPRDKDAVQFAKRLARLAYQCFAASTLSTILTLIASLIAIVHESVPQGKPADFQQELNAFIAEGKNDTLVFPYRRIERLCYLCFHKSDPQIRAQAFDLLTQVGELFEWENDDWANYEMNAQAFARQVNTDFSMFLKKNAESVTPRELLDHESRSSALVYLSRRISTNRQPFAMKILREAIDLSDLSPYLMDLAVAVISPGLVRKMGTKGIQPLFLLEKLQSCGKLSSLKYLHIDFFQPFLDKIVNDPTFSDLTIQILDGLTDFAASHIELLSPEMITQQIQYVQKLTLSHQDVVTRMPRSIRNIAEEVANSSLNFDFLETLLRLCFESPHGHDVFETILSLEFAMLRNDINFELVNPMFQNPFACDFRLMRDFFRKVAIKFPAKLPALLKCGAQWVPDVVTSVLMEHPIADMKSFTMFCYQISETHDPILFGLARQFVHAQFPNTADADGPDALIAAFVGAYPELAPDMLTLAEEYSATINQKVINQGKLVGIFGSWFRVWTSEFERVIGLLIRLSEAFLPVSRRFSEFWQYLVSDPNRAQRVFTLLINSGAEKFVTDFVYEICAHKPAIQATIANTIFTNLIAYVASEIHRPLVALFQLATQDPKMTPSTAFLLGVMSQVSGLKDNAQAALKRILPDVPDDLFDLVRRLCDHLNPEHQKSVLNAVLDSIKNAHTFESFAALIRLLSCLIKSETGGLWPYLVELVAWFAAAQKLELFGECFAFFFDAMARCVSALSMASLDFVVEFGFICADLGILRVNTSFAAFLAVVAQVPSSKGLPRLMTRVLQLSFRGDVFLEKVCEILKGGLLLENLRMVKDPVARYWIDATQGTVGIVDSQQVLDSLKMASVFGDILLLQKILEVIHNTKIRGDEHPVWLVDLVSFLLMSQEVKPTVSVALCNEIERAFGKVMGTQGYIAPSMKIGLADIVQRMAPTRT